jgi:hypothetical protein
LGGESADTAVRATGDAVTGSVAVLALDLLKVRALAR